MEDGAQVHVEVEPDLAGRIVVRVGGALDLPEVADLRTILDRGATATALTWWSTWPR